MLLFSVYSHYYHVTRLFAYNWNWLEMGNLTGSGELFVSLPSRYGYVFVVILIATIFCNFSKPQRLFLPLNVCKNRYTNMLIKNINKYLEVKLTFFLFLLINYLKHIIPPCFPKTSEASFHLREICSA